MRRIAVALALLGLTGAAALPASAQGQVTLFGQRYAVVSQTVATIFGQRYDDTGTAVGTEFQISATGVSSLLFASVGALAGGGFVVAWQQGVFNSADIHAQRYDASGTKVGNEFTVNSDLPNEQLDVRV